MIDFGGKLRQARERRGVSLRQIAASTKISVSALEALERNDVSKLPGGIFSRAFVRSYACEVGLDPAETIREFLETVGAEQEEPEKPAPVFEDPVGGGRQVAAVALLIVILVAVAAFFVLRGRATAGPVTAVAAPAAVS